jgi:hypothetical protein
MLVRSDVIPRSLGSVGWAPTVAAGPLRRSRVQDTGGEAVHLGHSVDGLAAVLRG